MSKANRVAQRRARESAARQAAAVRRQRQQVAGAAIVAAAVFGIGGFAVGQATSDTATDDGNVVTTAATTTGAPVGLSPTEAAALLQAPPAGLQILDVRTAEEFASGRLDGATNIDFYQPGFASRLESELDPDRPVLVYCRSGNRSGQAAQLLAELGFDEIYDLDGGVNAWAGAGFSLSF